MDEHLTISKEPPAQKSMDYNLLREEGLKYIQNIAGKVWTDYNVHDPGITILEVLCYAITDLGYRTSYDIKDIITPDPDADEQVRNFFTAAEIMPNAPLTPVDYRKLMIDVEVHDPDDEGCEYAGVKNAWIEEAPGPEINIFVDKMESELVYEPVKPADTPLAHKILYNILLEFDECDSYGDLNENKIVRDYTIPAPEGNEYDAELEGVVIRVEVEFPRWDDEINWEDDASLVQGILGIDLRFLNIGDNFSIEYELNFSNLLVLSGTKTSPSGPDDIDGLDKVTQQLHNFIFESDDSMLTFYRQKIAKIRAIIDEVKSTLHANRNLCEDFLQFNALRIEEILVCGDIELELDAEVEETQARMYHEIAKFLSPTVYFYTLDEMMTRCFDEHQHDVMAIDTEQRIFTINTRLDPLPEKETVISITDSNNNNGTYTVETARINADDETRTDIVVQEAIPSGILTEDETLYLANLAKDQCTPTEQIFEGPLLNHGFIDDEELAQADRKKVIHVSDLIQIIMDVPGVVAVKNIQIANVPQDNEAGAIKSKSVKWCLDLAFDQNYVPRLNTDDSRITFFKDELPFRANQLEVDAIINELEQAERPQKRRNAVMDIEPPAGDYRDLENYYSIQNEFPLVYGIGEEGVPTRAQELENAPLPTETHAQQLKGFLMHFDQLLANYLSQLAHIKDLFSMNPQRDEFGNFVIGRTYYTQPLFDLVPNVDELYFDKAAHTNNLNNIAESEELFGQRRNRFLDHLMARFAEQFTDYTLLTYRISGPKSQEELIEDKLAFLNGYPELSSRRGTALNYRDACELWHIDNVSGLERRAALLTGIDERQSSKLNFSPNFKFTGTSPDIKFTVENDVPEEVLKSPGSYETKEGAKEALEKVIINGVERHKFSIKTDDETNYYFQLLCDGKVIAESAKTDFASGEEGGDADQAIDEVVQLLRDEFYNNPGSNRHNLACAVENYFDYSDDISVNMAANPATFTIKYDLYETPFTFDESDPILTGSFTGQGEAKENTEVLIIDTGSSTFTVAGDITENLAEDIIVVIGGSDASDGEYTISSFTLNGDGNTEITVNETIPSDSAPLGELLYNLVSEEEMQARAESAVHDVLWRVVASGVRRSNYSFDPNIAPYSSPYLFQIRDIRGNVLGESTASDFNEVVKNEIENVSSGKVTVIEPGEEPNEHEYGIISTTAKGPNVEIEVDESPSPSPGPDWQLQIQDSFPLKAISKAEQTFSIEADLTDKLKQGQTITIANHPGNNGDYTVLRVNFDATDSHIKVEEPIPSEEIPEEEEPGLRYSKTFSIIKTAGSVITIKGGADEAAVAEMMEFLQSTFFAHEGMHLIEHNLLRPKTNGLLFVDAGEETLAEGLSEIGELLFSKTHAIISASSAAKKFTVEGDITANLESGAQITVNSSLFTDRAFTIESFEAEEGNTEIVVAEFFVTDENPDTGGWTLSFPAEEAISGIDAAGQKITIPANVAEVLAAGSIIEIQDSADGKNDSRYTVQSATDVDSTTEIAIEKVERLVQDRLLSINLDEECACTLEDPYTCMAHVIMPYWPGRFTNNDFRTFFEKTLRREAPAHIYLNICWVSCSHMAAFERTCKAWLLENARPEINNLKLSQALHELIDSIEQLRNVYPEGKLHDCDEDESLENAIILNNSVLGEI